MRVRNLKNSQGRSIANQFVIEEYGNGANGNFDERLTYQSCGNYRCGTVIAKKTIWKDGSQTTELDSRFWDYSATMGKYRNRFLGENKKETQKKINSGVYTLTNLNKRGAK